MSGANLNERRFRSWDPSLTPGNRPCRLCLNVMVLEPWHIETTDMYVYVRCPHCEGSFPIRHSDVAELHERTTPIA